MLNKTMVYNYDAGGNITSKVQYTYTTGALGTPSTPNTIKYVYDATWKDKLTSYNGKPIEYPATGDIGNPIKYDNYSFTWEAGRQLKGISGNGKTIAYKYNDSRIRTQKIVNGVTTNYHLEGDKVTFESNGTDKMYYTYDSSGNLVSMNLNDVEYYYIRNAQSDIVGLFNNEGTQVVSYVYDSWGKLESIKDGSGADITNNTSSVGYKNPYRYKGYRYDTETGLYYLQSRYYNPEWGRFINADGIVGTPGELLSCNMFVYCKNNPINLMDIDGRNPFAAILAWGVEAVVEAVVYTVVTYVAAVATHLLVSAVMDAINSQSSDAPSNGGGAIGTSPSSPVDTPSDNSDTSSSAKTKTRTKKGELKRAKLPVKGKIRFVPSTNWRPTQPIPRIREGLVDRFGNVWKKGPLRTAGEEFEWDVQLSRIGESQLGRFSRDGSHINVSLEGRITHR